MQKFHLQQEQGHFGIGGRGYIVANSASFLDSCRRNLYFLQCLENGFNFCVLN